VSCRGNPSRPVHLAAHISALASAGLACVGSHPHRHRTFRQSRLRFARSGQSRVRVVENVEERVALSIDLDAAVAGERVAKHGPVLS
jgi:hypothetical protein